MVLYTLRSDSSYAFNRKSIINLLHVLLSLKVHDKMTIVIGRPSKELFSLGLFTRAEASIITRIGNNYTVRGGLRIRKVYG